MQVLPLRSPSLRLQPLSGQRLPPAWSKHRPFSKGAAVNTAGTAAPGASARRAGHCTAFIATIRRPKVRELSRAPFRRLRPDRDYSTSELPAVHAVVPVVGPRATGCSLIRLLRGAARPPAHSKRSSRPSASANGAGVTSSDKPSLPSGPLALLVRTVQLARQQVAKLDGLYWRFLPMVALFFCMAFVNTILDSIKDSLVITAVGGGTEVLPFLTVYGVLPASLLFLLAYSAATQRFSREALFNVIVVLFLAFYGAFALVYPSIDALHSLPLADHMAKVLPPGLSGLVGMVRNWTFTLFYCCSELWGDVVLSLLFWGLANETTPMRDAPLLYPLFGIGANVAQTAAGQVLRLFARSAHSAVEYGRQLQLVMALVMVMGVLVLLLHAHIARTFPRTHEGLSKRQQEKEWKALEAARRESSALAGPSDTPAASHNGTAAHSKPRQVGPACALDPKEQRRPKMGLAQAFRFLAASPQIRCLAMMAVAQGVSSSVVDLAWKSQLRILHPTPGAYSAFMGDVAMWTGVVTGSLMFTSPILFDALGWEGVAAATPRFLIAMGVPFFIGCIAFNHIFVNATASVRLPLLSALVLSGAVLQVFGKGAKFSLFKPAEEMVYIGLDEESRTKGKAAIDVVGAQSGKSVGSLLQQVLLVASGGAIAGALPFLTVVYVGMLMGWLRSCNILGTQYNPTTHHGEDNDALPPAILQTFEEFDTNADATGGLNGSSDGGVSVSTPLHTPA